MDSEEFVSDLAAQVDRVLVILYALLGLSVVIAVLGIVNTLALSVIERTREIGLLRAVGLGRLQLGTTITLESVLTAVFGTTVGLVAGRRARRDAADGVRGRGPADARDPVDEPRADARARGGGRGRRGAVAGGQSGAPARPGRGEHGMTRPRPMCRSMMTSADTLGG